MLVEGNTSSPSAAAAADIHFARGDRASASVRLRSKSREAGKAERGGGGRLLSRHSGDFGHFNAASKMELAAEGDCGGDEDWAYITYPNGVPTVREVREQLTSEAEPRRTPVKVVTREVPGVSLAGLKLGADNGTESPTSTASSAASSKNRFRGGNGRNSNSPAAAAAAAASVAAKSSEENVRFRRRLSEQPPNAASMAAAASTKRCSGEFQFVRTAKNGLVGGGGEATAGSEQQGREDAAAPKFRTPTRGGARAAAGLGRRAATQVQIERGERKNSYSAAMYKSQDNLVKVRCMFLMMD